uniref:Sema domain-containing protein n=1 Tax=Monopterus albus TaxID=43700 RepID=A0A3Q3KH50_MONAL
LPRVKWTCGDPHCSPGRHVICFNIPDVCNTTTLLLSEDGDMLYVGARDAVLALDVSRKDSITLRSKVGNPSDRDLEQCSMKGKKMADCPNFIRVLQFLNTSHIYACGTFAFSPRCTYIVSLLLLCNYNAFFCFSDGELYTGTVADYRGNRPVISRHLSEGRRVDLKLDDTLGWLEGDSSFIPDEEKIYFFFSEVGREYDFIDKFIVSRVSQVCMSDVGGQRTLQRRWTTFAKAQLLCQADNELPYNVIQDIDRLSPAERAPADDTLFYGIFTSQSVNSGRSAVCSFRQSDIKAVFSGNYKVLNRDTLQWSTRVQEKVANPGECGLHNASDNALRFVKENFLADDSVRPVGRIPIMVSAEIVSLETLSVVNTYSLRSLTVMETQECHPTESLHWFRLHQNVQYNIDVQRGSCKSHHRMLFVCSHSVPLQSVIYVGTSEAVVRVPTANCSFYWTCAQCVLARDPFCGWDPASRACVEFSPLRGQDIDRGNVEDSCSSVSLTHRARFASCPAGELVSVSLNEVVRLQCPAVSRLSQQQWERPNSRLSSDLYLQLGDGSLTFVATPATLGHYLCLSTENDYQQTMAIYHVKQRSSTMAQNPTSHIQPQTHPVPTTRAVARPGPVLHTSVRGWPKRKGARQGETEPTLSSRDTQTTTRQLGGNLTLWTHVSGQDEAEFWDGEPLLGEHKKGPKLAGM